MLYKKTILLLALHVTALAHSQNICNGIFAGQVADEANRVLAGASIVLLPGNIGIVADGQGKFRLGSLCTGTYQVKVQHMGYQAHQFTVSISGEVTQNIVLTEVVQQLNEVIVQDHAMPTENAQNYVRLNEKDLAGLAGKSLGELLKEVPGTNTIQTGPGIFKPVIHGVHSQRVLILNYGIRQEGQQWGAEHAPEIDPFIASEIVVIKDASSIKYGTDALGGVIVVNPPPLPQKAGLAGTFNTVFQSNGRSATASGMLEGGIGDGWGWRLQGTTKRTGDFQTPTYSLTNTGIKELNFSASTGYHQESKGVDVFFSHFQTQLGILKGTSIGNIDDLVLAMQREIPQYTTGFSYNIGAPRQEVSHNLFKVNGHTKAKFGEWRVQYGFQNNNRKEFDIRIGQLSKIPSIDLQLNTHTLEVECENVKPDKRTTTFGITSMAQNNSNLYGTQRIPFIPNFTNWSGGIFGITKFYLKNATLDFGMRYDYRYYAVKGFDFKNVMYNTALRFNNVSATAGATLQVKKDQTVNISVSSAWRPPNVAELYSLGTHQSAAAIEYGLLLNDSTNEVMNISNVPFKIEQAFKCVLTYQRVWHSFQPQVSPYVNYIANYIYLRPTGITQNVRGTYPYLRYTQTDALFMGIDLSGVWQADKFIKVIPKASLLRAADQRNHDYLVFIPASRYEVAIRYEKPTLLRFKNFGIESKVKYVARQNRAPRVVTVQEIKQAQDQRTDPFQGNASNFDFMAPPAEYWLWNVAAGISVKNTKAQYDFRIASENILNTTYREYTNRFRYYANDLGRNIMVSIKCIF